MLWSNNIIDSFMKSFVLIIIFQNNMCCWLSFTVLEWRYQAIPKLG